jgi:diaminopropionate ammonia-lyase
MADLPKFDPTPLLDLPQLAQRANVGRVFVKDEGQRPLGNFKVLGGMVAGLNALARTDLAHPRLITASDGNHGLAVAAAARAAGAEARIYLPGGVSPNRAARIEAEGGEVVWVEGTYDDAVDTAAAAAVRGEGILVPDTTSRSVDRVVDDVMSGYRRICVELHGQLPEPPTHLFVQAGVGGLAAAMAEGLEGRMAAPARLVVVEPASAPCVAAGLSAGRPVRIGGDLHSSAEMLACGLASTPALDILLRHRASSIAVDEGILQAATTTMLEAGGPSTTPSGAAGLAGLLDAADDPERRGELELASDSRVLLIATERIWDGGSPTRSAGSRSRG